MEYKVCNQEFPRLDMVNQRVWDISGAVGEELGSGRVD